MPTQIGKEEGPVQLQHLITFCRVVDLNSFTQAAQELNLSQPAVTKQVKALEQELGTRLLTRRGRQLRLTPAGEILYPYAKRTIHTLQECRDALQALHAPGRGTLAIGTVPTIALFTLPDLLAQFAREYPMVSLRLRTGVNAEIADLVLRSEVDLGILPVPFTHEELQTIPLFHDPILLVSSPQAPWADRAWLSPVDLSRLPMICYRRGTQFRNFVDAHFDAAGITVNEVMEFDSHEAVKAMVMAGFGVAMEPWSAVAKELREGRLVELAIAGFEELGRITSLIMRRDRHQSPPVRAFLRLVRSTFPNPPRVF